MNSLRLFSASLFVVVFVWMFPLCLSCPPESSPFLPTSAQPVFDADQIKANNGVIHVQENEQFGIRLSSNPTTGYSWTIVSTQLPMLGCSYTRNCVGNGCPIGGGGVEIFGWQALKIDGLTTVNIHLKYARPWENNNGVADLVVTVIID